MKNSHRLFHHLIYFNTPKTIQSKKIRFFSSKPNHYSFPIKAYLNLPNGLRSWTQINKTAKNTNNSYKKHLNGAQKTEKKNIKINRSVNWTENDENDKEIDRENINKQSQFLPSEVVSHLNRYIVGQQEAKKAVAIAFRNRWRRHRVPKHLRNEIMPKNMLMVGPTGCGKTEIARRLAKIADVPFIKVEATKFTEVGFHGRDVDTIIKDLMDVSIENTKKRIKNNISKKMIHLVEKKIIDALISKHAQKRDRDLWLRKLRNGDLEEHFITLNIESKASETETYDIPITTTKQHIFLELKKYPFSNHQNNQNENKEQKDIKIKDARKFLLEQECEKNMNTEMIYSEAKNSVEQDGIVFIDELDKICTSPKDVFSSADASAEGVQRDLLPLIEGTTVSTKFGLINTDHIMFIGSGAFHNVKPSDLMAELQGRLPIRVVLKKLSQNDLERILKEPEYNLIRQECAMLGTENLKLIFESNAIKEIARVASEVNSESENIGARRLYHILEKVMEDISFGAPEKSGQEIRITSDYVIEKCRNILKKNDFENFIL